MTESSTSPAVEEIAPDDASWELEGNDSVGDADDPHRNDDGQFDHIEAVSS